MSGAITEDRLADLGPVIRTPEEDAAAATYVARVACDEDDRAELLAALGLAS